MFGGEGGRRIDMTSVAAQTTRVYTWSQNFLEHSGMTHVLINNTVSILFSVRLEPEEVRQGQKVIN